MHRDLMAAALSRRTCAGSGSWGGRSTWRPFFCHVSRGGSAHDVSACRKSCCRRRRPWRAPPLLVAGFPWRPISGDQSSRSIYVGCVAHAISSARALGAPGGRHGRCVGMPAQLPSVWYEIHESLLIRHDDCPWTLT
ncbi:hypothetical protein MTO96_001450 [Rhipicephalus appendiculatus]